jgi:ankyrin repeat protein
MNPLNTTSTTSTYITSTTSNTNYIGTQILEEITCFNLDTVKYCVAINEQNANKIEDENTRDSILERIQISSNITTNKKDEPGSVKEGVEHLIAFNKQILSFLNPSPADQWLDKILAAIDIAVENQSFEEVISLLEEGNKHNFLDKRLSPIKSALQSTLLQVLAAKRNAIAIFRLLLKYNINPSLQQATFFKNTALHIAIAGANDEAAMELIDLAKTHDFLNIQCKHGNSALHIAVAKGYKNISRDNEALKHSYLEIAKNLILHSCDVNLQNCDRMGKNSPLHLACLRREPEMIEVLLKAGADLSLKTAEGKTAKELLDFDYESAAAIIRKNVVIYLLDKEEHENNLNKCHDLFN